MRPVLISNDARWAWSRTAFGHSGKASCRDSIRPAIAAILSAIPPAAGGTASKLLKRRRYG